MAAVLLGVAAAFKLYPALLGVFFLADKRWKEAFLCAGTGIVLTCLSLSLFQGGFIVNLQDWLAKTAAYNQYGNLDLRRIMMNNNALVMLWDIPYYIASGGRVTLEEMAVYNRQAQPVVLVLMGLCCLICLIFRRQEDKALLLCLWMVGYPYNSSPYNLVVLVAPLIYWAALGEGKGAVAMLGMGAALVMCKTRFALFATTVRHITLQSMLNPLLIAGMILLLLWMRRHELLEDVQKVFRRAKAKEDRFFSQ